MNQVYVRYLIYVLLVAFTLLVLAACGNPNVATPTSLSTLTPPSTSTPSNEFFLGEILKTPQPSPWATTLPNDSGIIPGITTEDEVLSRFGNPDGMGCIIDNKESWWNNPDCRASGGFRKFWDYPNRNLSLQTDQGRVVSVIFTIWRGNPTVHSIIAVQGLPELVKFTIPVKRSEPPAPSPVGELVYASKGVEYLFGCDKGSGQLCEGVPEYGDGIWETHFVPMSVTDWLEQEKTNPPFYPDRGVEFYIRPWMGYIN